MRLFQFCLYPFQLFQLDLDPSLPLMTSDMAFVIVISLSLGIMANSEIAKRMKEKSKIHYQALVGVVASKELFAKFETRVTLPSRES